MQSQDPVDRPYQQLLGLITQYGWAIRHVGSAGTAPGFSYTVGLTAMGHPEFVMTGMPFEASQGFLNLLGADVRDGKRYAAGTVVWDLTEPPAPIAIIAVSETTGLTAIDEVYGRVDALQAIWSDSTGHLPWDEGYRNPPDTQPLLGPLPVWRLGRPGPSS
ncbi:DUF4262 domain-containing protein [Agromyces marinus]|uniref:DUF4262 domain-containing protein n=1 Tax=Agromyces marinus TaxID=1389020 RepID=UPI0038993BCB